jgi:putative flippase GtrA
MIASIRLSKRFIKSQINSAVSTLLDFCVTVFLTEYIGIWYLLSSATGTFLGGCCNYTLGRHWVFGVIPPSRIKLLFRYLFFWCINFTINVSMVYLLTDQFKIKYMFSKIIVAIVCGVFVNYYLQKKIVYNVQVS